MDGTFYVNAASPGVIPGYSKAARLEVRGLADRFLVWALSAIVAGLVFTTSCATPVTILAVSAPSTATAGSPITVTVTAMAEGTRDRIFNVNVHFSSSDSSAILPIDYAFTAADAGSHTFTNGVTFMTPGTQSITATATVAHSITGSADVAVSAATNAMRK